MAGGGAGQMPTGNASTQTTQYNTGSNWANPVQGTPWQNPTTGSPYMGVGSLSNTGAMVYQAPASYSEPPNMYGDLTNPANAAGRRQQNIDLANQSVTQQTMNAQLPQSLGTGGYGYGPGYSSQGGFGYNPYGAQMGGQGGYGGQMGGIMGLLSALGFGGQMGGFGGYRGMGDRRFGPPQQPQQTVATPATSTDQGITSLTS